MKKLIIGVLSVAVLAFGLVQSDCCHRSKSSQEEHDAKAAMRPRVRT
jgi:hypothetical protein